MLPMVTLLALKVDELLGYAKDAANIGEKAKTFTSNHKATILSAPPMNPRGLDWKGGGAAIHSSRLANSDLTHDATSNKHAHKGDPYCEENRNE